MEHTEFRLSENTTGEVSSDNPAIRFARSQFGALLMLFVSLLYPFEAFSANCQLKASPICMDSTPCKDVIDSNGATVKTCLSTALNPTPGSLISTASCWEYKATYDCIDQSSPTYSDTCNIVKDGGNCTNYAEKSVACNPNEPKLSGGACGLFDVSYQCEVAAGTPYQETTCSSGSSCVDANGAPSFCTGPVVTETNTSFGMMVAGAETARQAGTYLQTGDNPGETDPTKIGIFKGEANRCAEGMWGMAASCCVPDSKGASATNAIITEQLIQIGWNAIAENYVGSEYAFDTILDKTVNLVEKALDMMQTVMSGVSNSVSAVNTATTGSSALGGAIGGTTAASSSMSVVNAAGAIGGAIGGAVAGAAASQYAAKLGANTGWTGTAGALGSAAGSYVGTYAGGYVAGAFTSGGAAAGGTQALGMINPYYMVAMIIVAMIMSFAACTPEDMRTQMKLGAPGLCHFVGTYCNTKDILGGCITTMQQYCCFNSRIGRIIQEGAKGDGIIPGQIGNWGTPTSPNCAEIKVSDLANLDFSKIDMSEFIDDIVTKNIPTGEGASTQVLDRTKAFVDANSIDVTATDGVIVQSSTTQLPPPTLPTVDMSGTGNATPMAACNVAFKIDSMLADGTTTGTFNVANCNPGAMIVWSNYGNCAGAPVTSTYPTSTDFTTSAVDSAGAASMTVTLPPACFGVTTPPTQNIWKGIVTLQPDGTLGVIDAIWQ